MKARSPRRCHPPLRVHTPQPPCGPRPTPGVGSAMLCISPIGHSEPQPDAHLHLAPSDALEPPLFSPSVSRIAHSNRKPDDAPLSLAHTHPACHNTITPDTSGPTTLTQRPPIAHRIHQRDDAPPVLSLPRATPTPSRPPTLCTLSHHAFQRSPVPSSDPHAMTALSCTLLHACSSLDAPRSRRPGAGASAIARSPLPPCWP